MPAESMSHYLQIFAENQPITQVINTIRSLMLDQPIGDYLRNTVLWCIALLAISIPIAAALFKRRSAN